MLHIHQGYDHTSTWEKKVFSHTPPPPKSTPTTTYCNSPSTLFSDMKMSYQRRFPVNLDRRQNLITTSALDKHSPEFYAVSRNPWTGCPDALITLSHLEAKAGIKHLKSNSVKSRVLTLSPTPTHSCSGLLLLTISTRPEESMFMKSGRTPFI